MGILRLDTCCGLGIFQGSLFARDGLLGLGQLTFQGLHSRFSLATGFRHRLGIRLHIGCTLFSTLGRLLAGVLYQFGNDLADPGIKLDVRSTHGHSTRLPLIQQW
ncbi:hypothetical protein D3C81_2093230 [compost metagenome]